MTIEEAIADIRDNIKPVVGEISLDMAIKSLEMWEKVKEEMQEQYIIFANIASISDIWADAIEIVDKHLAEVKNE